MLIFKNKKYLNKNNCRGVESRLVGTARQANFISRIVCMFFVYVIISLKTGRLYIGQTDNLQRRLAQHNNGEVRSTKSFRPWKLIYRQKFSTRREAMQREKYLKSLKNKKYLLKVIAAG